jgi:hypothetical protein
MHHLSDLFDRRQYLQIDKFINQVNIKVIDKWDIWLEMANNMRTALESID